MSLALQPNLPPPGTRTGSPVVVVDQYKVSGQTEGSTAFRIPITAEPGDVCLAIFGDGLSGTSPPGDNLLSWTESPLTSFPFLAGASAVPPTTAVSEVRAFYHVVKAGEPGTTIGFGWAATHYLSWGLKVFTLRYLNTASPFVGIHTNASAGNASHSPTNGAGQAAPNTLLIGCMTAAGGSLTNTGISVGPVAGWYNGDDIIGGSQPNFAMTTGLVDMSMPGTYEGADTTYSQPSGTGINVGFATLLVQANPISAPSGAKWSLTPSGTSIDAQGLSGVPLRVDWKWTPVNGQGAQQAWLLARQEHGTGLSAAYWNADLNIWQASEYWNYSAAAKSYVFPASAFVDDGRNWDLYGSLMEDQLGYHHALTLIGTFTADPPPAVIATGPVGSPVSAQPITWTPVLTTGYSQVAAYVRVYSSDQYLTDGFDPEGLVDDDTAFPAAHGIADWNSDVGCSVAGGSVGITLTADGTNANMAATSFSAQSGHEGPLTQLTGVGLYPCKPGDSITTHQWFQANTTGRTCFAGLQFFKADGTFISAVQGASITDSATPQRAVLTTTAPAGAAFFILWPAVNAVASGEKHFVQTVSAYPTALVPRASSGAIQSSSTTSWTPSPALRGGGYYRAFVREQQTGGQISPWEPVDHFAHYNGVATPTITAVASTDPTTGAPAAAVTVTGHDPNTLSGTTFVNLARYNQKTGDWDLVRNGQGVALSWPSQKVTILDLEMPPNTPVTYEAQVYSTSPTGP